MHKTPYCCPVTKTQLHCADSGLINDKGKVFPFLSIDVANQIPVFIDEELLSGGDKLSQTMYTKNNTETIYENFLAWLFETFNEDEAAFRNSLIEKLHVKEGDRVLVTGCGLGDDVKQILPKIGTSGELFAQDISDVMIVATARRLAHEVIQLFNINNLYLSISNASMLPFSDSFFDAAYHFGGINLFSDIRSAIHEMARVVKPGGKVVIGDEGVAPWLKEKEYGKVAINNIKLWDMEPPLSSLPETASKANLSWVLGNCFYVIDFEVASSLPVMDMDVPIKGTRGGSMRKRYFGQLEGIDPVIKKKVELAASTFGKSISAWVEEAVVNALKDDATAAA